MKNLSKTFFSQNRRAVEFFLLALGLRLAYWLILKSFYLFYDSPSGDALYYQSWAQDILAGGRPGVFFGLPLYAYFLAVLKILTLNNGFWIRLLHLVLGSANCVLVYYLARRVFNERAAALTAILVAINFSLIHYDWLMMPVTVLISLSLMILLFLERQEFEKNKRQWFFLGILVGIAALGDGKFLFFAFFLSLYYWSRFPAERFVNLRFILIPFLCGMCLILAAVGLRNRLVGGDWVLISAQSGLSFYIGNNPASTGVFENPDFIRPTHEGQDLDQVLMAQKALNRTLKPSEVSSFYRRQGWEFIWQNPRAFFDLLRKKFLAFWCEHEGAYDLDLLFQRRAKNFLDFNPYFCIVPLALLGIVFSIRKNFRTRFSFFLILSQLAMTLVFFLTHRHRTTILPLLIMFESWGIFWIWGKIKEKNYSLLAFVGVCLLILFVSFRPVSLDKNSMDFLWLSKAGALQEKKGRLDEAKADYVKALQINPHDPNILCNLANVFFQQKNYNEAIRNYKKALQILPFHLDALYNLAFTYERIQDFSSAMAYFYQVITLDPSSYDAHFHLGQLHLAQGQCENALYHFHETLRLKPILKKEIEPLLSSCLNNP